MEDTITILPIGDVYPNPRHYREVVGASVKTLAASIKVAGQTDPITVFRDGDVFIVDSGHHRLAAMKALGMDTIRAIVMDDIDEKRSAEIMVASNMHFPATEIESSRGTQMMLATGVRPIDAAAVSGINQDLVSRAHRGLAIAKDYAEDMSLERIAVLPEFEGDEEATKMLLTCYENEWPAVYARLSRSKKLAEAVERCTAVIAGAGCELTDDVNQSGRVYLSRGDEVPEGAKWGRISESSWSGTAEVIWYGDVPAEDAEAVSAKSAALELEEHINSELAAARVARRSWLAGYLNSEVSSLSNAPRDLAVTLWEDEEDSFSAGKENLRDALVDVRGFTPRIYASILGEIDATADNILFRRNGWTNYFPYDNDGSHALAYFDALTDAGYELSPVEAGLVVELREFVGVDEEAETVAEGAVCYRNGDPCSRQYGDCDETCNPDGTLKPGDAAPAKKKRAATPEPVACVATNECASREDGMCSAPFTCQDHVHPIEVERAEGDAS